MPITSTGMKIMRKMVKTYTRKTGSRKAGRKKAKQVFYAMEREGKMTSKAVKRQRKRRNRRERRYG